jgi:hypothetical protein
MMSHQTTPDGRYLVVRGRPWRCTNPMLAEDLRTELTRELMAARRAKGVATRAEDAAGRETARARVDAAKRSLGERGPPWWTDGAPDLTRKMAANTPYAAWGTAVDPATEAAGAPDGPCSDS